MEGGPITKESDPHNNYPNLQLTFPFTFTTKQPERTFRTQKELFSWSLVLKILNSEAAARGVLKISQNSQEDICARASIFTKVAGLQAFPGNARATLRKKETTLIYIRQNKFT